MIGEAYSASSGSQRDEVEPHHAADRLEQPELELDPQPVAPGALADFQLFGVAVGAEHDPPALAIDPQVDLDAEVAPLGAAGPDQVGGEHAIAAPGWGRTTFSLSRGFADGSVV